jgi:hypothetical protein
VAFMGVPPLVNSEEFKEVTVRFQHQSGLFPQSVSASMKEEDTSAGWRIASNNFRKSSSSFVSYYNGCFEEFLHSRDQPVDQRGQFITSARKTDLSRLEEGNRNSSTRIVV